MQNSPFHLSQTWFALAFTGSFCASKIENSFSFSNAHCQHQHRVLATIFVWPRNLIVYYIFCLCAFLVVAVAATSHPLLVCFSGSKCKQCGRCVCECICVLMDTTKCVIESRVSARKCHNRHGHSVYADKIHKTHCFSCLQFYL